MSTELTPAQLATTAEHLLAAKMFSLASCVMLFYDITITFGDEVERIWKQRFTGATVLWFLNRYLSPLGYIVIIVSFQDPNWSKAACQHYVLYPEVLKVFTTTAVGIIFILRLYSIYAKSNTVLYGFTTLLALELAVKIWAFTDGTMLQLPPGFVGCILTGRSAPGDRLIYTWVAELVFDSCVFFATLYRTIQLYRRTVFGEARSLITVVMRDGIMYFAAIFFSNLVTVLIFIFAPNDLKVINASFSTLITSLMVSRLMLNLRGEVLRRGPVMSSHHSATGIVRDNGAQSYQMSSREFSKPEAGWTSFTSSIVGNLGAPVITFEADNSTDYEDLNDDDLDSGNSSKSHDALSPRSPRSPYSASPPSYHPYPPSPVSPHTADPLRHNYDDHYSHSRYHTESSDDTMGWTIVSMTDRIVDPPSALSSPSYPLPLRPSTSPGSSPRTVSRQPSAESSGGSGSSASALTALPPRKARLAGMKSLRRPRTSESEMSDRDVVEMMQTRSLPAPLVVQVTEEVVVEEMAGPSGAEETSPRSPSGRTRRPWLAPPSWKLSRDGHYEEG
ncbi:hypothetical protein BD310DRAFT_714735 [Dichomitus squalens]|uniref:DUF6533 domain-containing protein n=1 Tax=Dichomitus squalens TaxID=114155 RepID=A0A4V2K783_9APHY|nr:hypothetical protein BD310DRAFT_714735 [Dichomitus squalens]